MTRRKRDVTSAIVTYLVLGFLTFGEVWDHTSVPEDPCGERPSVMPRPDIQDLYKMTQFWNQEALESDWELCHMQLARRDDRLWAIPAGVFWPAYWAARVSIRVMK